MKSMAYIKLFLCFLFFLPLASFGQSEAQLMENIRQLQKQLEETRNLYGEKISRLEEQINSLEEKIASPRDTSGQMPASAVPPRTMSAAVLPDISFIGNVIGEFGRGAENSVFLEEVEIALGGYVFPDMRADVIIALHEHDGHYEAELEEAYLSMFNLPGGFGLLAGRKLIDFGKINPIHGHHYFFVDEPLATEMFLGDHGLAGNGVSVNYLFPVPFFLQGSLGYWELGGDECDGHHHGMDYAGRAVNARLWSSFEVADAGELEVGASYLRAKGDHHFDSPRDKDKVNLYGFDITYTHAGRGFRRFMFRNEFYFFNRSRFRPEREIVNWVQDPDDGSWVPGPGHGNIRPAVDASWNRKGFYSLLHYRFNQYWDAGLRYDWSESFRNNDDKDSAYSVFATRSLTETTKLRGQASYYSEDSDWRFYIQALFGLGPHAHPLE